MQTRSIVRRTVRAPQVAPQTPEGKLVSSFWRVAAITLLLAFMAGGVVSGYIFYETVRAVVASIPISTTSASVDVPSVPIIAHASSAPAGPSNTSPGAPAAVQPQAQLPLGQQRINILLLGTDQRPEDNSPGRTDTMIVVSIDPASKSVGMLSFPRDLWVPIPGMGFEDRINTAYFYGELKKLPGGGPALAEKAIQYNFGIPINHYILINLVGFRKMIDALGGVTIDVPETIDDPTFPDDTYGYLPLHIDKGVQHMNGDLALMYARTRHQSSDFYRMRRQQQVLMAIKDQALRPDTLAKIPALWAAHDNLVWTDLKLEDIVALSQLATQVKSDNIHSAVVDESMALGITTPGGAMVLWPDREKIRTLIDNLLKPAEGAPLPIPTQAQAQAQPTPQTSEQIQKLLAENARIEISNGTATDGLAQRVADWLKAQGFNIVLADDADRRDYDQTVVVQSSDRPYTKGLLLTIFGVSQNLRPNPNPNSDIDLRIIIGKDFDTRVIPDNH